MKSGLYTAPGDSATARAAATARRLPAPTTRLSNRSRASSCMLRAPAAGAQLSQDLLGDRAKRLEDAGPVERVRGERRHTAEVELFVELGNAENEVRWQVLLVVLDHERRRSCV